MLTRVLAVATILLGSLVIHQYSTINELRGAVTAADVRALPVSRSVVAGSLAGQQTEARRAMTWLNEYYKAPDGLGRPDGLWIDGHPDFDALSTWMFDFYLRRRLKGETEEQVLAALQAALKQTDEWRVKHPT